MQAPENMQKIPRPCVYFTRGDCRKGEKCLFQHLVDAPKVNPLYGQKSVSIYSLPRMQVPHDRHSICRFWSMGVCRSGEKCPFRHIVESASVSTKVRVLTPTNGGRSDGKP
jgi:RNA-binding, Nab2-type zinc finger